MNQVPYCTRPLIRPVFSPWIRFSSKSSRNSDIKSNRDISENELFPNKSSPRKEVTKEDLQWRTPWHKKNLQHYNFLRVFYKEDNNAEKVNVDLSLTKVKNWWTKKVVDAEIEFQAYIPERNQMLGNELAAAHFIVHRGGAVKFHGDDKWIKADERNNYVLPPNYEAGKTLQAIDCSDMKLYYEGLLNLKKLRNVEWLSFNGCEMIDDWCLDRIGNMFSHSLVYLDLRDCPRITENGIGCLYKMDNLKILYLEDFLKNTSYELTCLLLQEVKPDLEIQSDKVTFEIPASGTDNMPTILDSKERIHQ